MRAPFCTSTSKRIDRDRLQISRLYQILQRAGNLLLAQRVLIDGPPQSE